MHLTDLRDYQTHLKGNKSSVAFMKNNLYLLCMCLP